MIHIAVASDRRYLPWCATMIHSCLVRNGADLHVHLLHDGSVSRSDLEPLEVMIREAGASVSIPTIDQTLVAALPEMPRFGGRTALLRLLLPQLAPGLNRILYLDVDTLVMASLRPLWETDLEGIPLAAVPNVVEPAMHERMTGLGLDPTAVFNSGVLLINLDLVRAERSFEQVLREVCARPEAFTWPDQDALNIAYMGRWRSLHPRWNAMNSLWTWPLWARQVFGDEPWREAKSDPAILHFEGPSICKPWHFLCTHPLRGVYHRNVAETPWRDTPLEDRTSLTRLIARLPERWRLPMYWRLHRARIWRRDAPPSLKRRIARARAG